MTLDYSIPGEVNISMIPYIEEIIRTFPEEIQGPASTPAADYFRDHILDKCERN